MRVLLTNAESAKTLACIRALGRNKVTAFVTGYVKKAPVFYSKYCNKSFVINNPDNEERFVEDIINIIKENKIDVLMPINSIETLVLSKHKNKIDKYCKFPFESFERMLLLNDKDKLMKTAEKLNIPHPETIPRKELKEDFSNVEFPCVFKITNSTSNKGVFYANNVKELRRIYAEKKKEEFIVQEFVKGQGCGVSYLYDKGKMIAYFAHERLREFPITGGPSTLRRGIKDTKLVEYGRRILDSVKWNGIAMVEFKKTPEGYKLLEVNPRFWGSVNQAISCGVNFPYLLVLKAIGEEPNIQLGDYNTKTKTKLYLNDIRSIISMIKNRKYPIWRIFEIFDFRNSDEFSTRDVLPFFYYIRYVWKNKR